MTLSSNTKIRWGRLPTVKVSGKKVTYWFWELNNQRLMICAFQSSSKNKGLELTIAMGDDVVLDALGDLRPKAQADQDSSRFGRGSFSVAVGTPRHHLRFRRKADGPNNKSKRGRVRQHVRMR